MGSPNLAGKLHLSLPNDWTVLSYREKKSPFRRVIRVYGPQSPRSIFPAPTLVRIYELKNHIEIRREACSSEQFTKIFEAVKANTDLPVEVATNNQASHELS